MGGDKTMKPFVGKYLFGQYEENGKKFIALSFSLHEKPSFIKRFFMKWLLGFVWVDDIH